MLKFKKMWAIDIFIKGQFIQLTSFKYKKEAIEESKKWLKTRIEKRILLTYK